MKTNMTKTDIIKALGYKGYEAKKVMRRTKEDLLSEYEVVNNVVDYTVDNTITTKEETNMKTNKIDGFAIIAQAQTMAQAQKAESIASAKNDTIGWKEQLAVTLWFRRPYSGNKNRSVFYTANPRKEYSGKIIAVYDTLVKYVEYWQRQYCAKLGYDPNKCSAGEARKSIGKMVEAGYFKYGFGNPSKVVILTPKVMECKDAVLSYWNASKQQ